jgi:DNA-binding TFAR19-related protein (PDSD5 family)
LNATDMVGMVVRDENARELESMGLKVSQHGRSLARVDHHQLVAVL